MAEREPNALGRQFSCLSPACFVLVVVVSGWTLDERNGSRRADAADIPVASPGAANPDADQRHRKAEFDEMRLRSEATQVYRLDGASKTALKLVSTPLMRYSDQPTSIADATLWAFTDARGRPLVLQKIETYRRPWTTKKSLYAMFSISEGIIGAQWRDGQQWTSTKPGVELRPIPDGPKAAENRTVRLRQIKEIARRFSVAWQHPGMGREEMRLISQPLYRYQHPESGLQDGAVIGFAAKGTNPDFAMVIQLDGKALGDSVWKYAATRLTSAQLVLRLDEKEVWSVPDVPLFLPQGPAKHDTWMVFFEAGQRP